MIDILAVFVQLCMHWLYGHYDTFVVQCKNKVSSRSVPKLKDEVSFTYYITYYVEIYVIVTYKVMVLSLFLCCVLATMSKWGLLQRRSSQILLRVWTW